MKIKCFYKKFRKKKKKKSATLKTLEKIKYSKKVKILFVAIFRYYNFYFQKISILIDYLVEKILWLYSPKNFVSYKTVIY